MFKILVAETLSMTVMKEMKVIFISVLLNIKDKPILATIHIVCHCISLHLLQSILINYINA